MTLHLLPSARREMPRSPDGVPPPSATAAEQAVLSACLLDRDARDEAFDALRPEHFWRPEHQIIAAVIAEQHAAGIELDVITVRHALERTGALQAAGGVTYLGELCDATPAVRHVREHAELVWAAWRRRRIIAEAQWVAAAGYDQSIADEEWIAEAHERMTAALSSTARQVAPAALKATLAELWAGYTDTSARGTPVATGLTEVDHRLGRGLYPGELVVVAARPGMGKTALVDHLEVQAAQSGAGEVVLSFSVEMLARERAQRKLCAEARVDGNVLRNRGLGAEDWSRMTAAGSTLATLPIVTDDAPDCTLPHIVSVARRTSADATRRNTRLRLVTVDYLQLLAVPHERGETRDRELAVVTRGLKVLAKQLGCPVVLVSQLNRGVETRGKDKRPMLSDLRESGAIEQDADAVLFIYRDDYYNRESKTRGLAEIIIAKQRNGPTGRVLVRFAATCGRFENVEESERNWNEPDTHWND